MAHYFSHAETLRNINTNHKKRRTLTKLFSSNQKSRGNKKLMVVLQYLYISNSFVKLEKLQRRERCQWKYYRRCIGKGGKVEQVPSTWPIDGQATWFASFFSKRGFSRRTARSRFSFIFPWSWPVHRRLQRRVAGIDFEWRITRGPSSASFPATGVPLGRGYIYVL